MRFVFYIVLAVSFLISCATDVKTVSLDQCKESANVLNRGPEATIERYWGLIAQCMQTKGFKYTTLCRSNSVVSPKDGSLMLTGAELLSCYE